MLCQSNCQVLGLTNSTLIIQNLIAWSCLCPDWNNTVHYSVFCTVYSQWCQVGFFSWLLTEPCALGLTESLKMSTRDFSWGKGGRCIRLMTYHPRSGKCQENLGP
jgi:hypothetical protein